jgi:CheY-like chemotaxis protein
MSRQMKSSQAPDPQAGQALPVRTPVRPPIRILFVDDSVDFRSAMKVTLEREGYEVELAANGARALELRRARAFDVMVTDLFMPEMDGFETMIKVRRESPSIKIIAMSSGGALRNPDMYLSTAGVAGADASIRKPFQVEALLEVLCELTGK